MKNRKYIPICLPTPEVFTKEKELEVKLVGWGLRYESISGVTTLVYKPKSSCLTNGARLIDAAYPESKRFIHCNKRGWGDYCWDVLKDDIHSFSTSTEVKFAEESLKRLPQFDMLNHAKLLFSLRKDDSMKKCNEYYDEAKKVWIDDMILKRSKGTINRAPLRQLFDEEVERFQIRRNDLNGKVIETCYNVNAVGRNGICQTNEEAPFNWGFCSTSCGYAGTPGAEDGDTYHEAIFKYLDTAPKSTFFSGNISQKLYHI